MSGVVVGLIAIGIAVLVTTGLLAVIDTCLSRSYNYAWAVEITEPGQPDMPVKHNCFTVDIDEVHDHAVGHSCHQRTSPVADQLSPVMPYWPSPVTPHGLSSWSWPAQGQEGAGKSADQSLSQSTGPHWAEQPPSPLRSTELTRQLPCQPLQANPGRPLQKSKRRRCPAQDEPPSARQPIAPGATHHSCVECADSEGVSARSSAQTASCSAVVGIDSGDVVRGAARGRFSSQLPSSPDLPPPRAQISPPSAQIPSLASPAAMRVCPHPCERLYCQKPRRRSRHGASAATCPAGVPAAAIKLTSQAQPQSLARASRGSRSARDSGRVLSL